MESTVVLLNKSEQTVLAGLGEHSAECARLLEHMLSSLNS
jgi:hypothetical protein